MMHWLHLARRDIRAAAAAPLLWLILFAWLGIVHAAFALTLLEVHGRAGAAAVPLYVDALWWGGMVLTLFAPALTMNAWAAERAQGTWQLLMTVPVRERDLVLGKFLAAWGLMLLLLGATLGMPAVLAVISEVSAPHALACYLGLVLLAAFLAALGTWVGLMVEGPVAAYVLTFAGIAVLWLAGIGGEDGPLGPLAAAVGLSSRIGPFLAGRVALADAAWFAAGTGIFLLLAHGAVLAQRQSGSLPWWRRAGLVGGPTAAIAVVLVLAVAAATRSGVAVDLSADHRFSLSPALVRQLAAAPSVDLVGVWDDRDDGALGAITDAGKAMAAAAKRGSWQRLDPQRHRPQLADFAARHGDPAPPALWVVRDGHANRIGLHRASRITLQRDVAGALLTLADPDPPTVRLLQGHGELRPGAAANDGCGQLLGSLTASGLRTALLDAAAPAPPPGDVIAVLGPTAPLGGADLGRLDAHLRDGGGLLVLADDRAPRDLTVWLRRRGMLCSGAVPVALAEERKVESVLDEQAPVLPAKHLVSLARHVAGAEHDLPHHNLLLRGEEHLNPQHPLTTPLVAGGLQLLSPFTATCEALPPQLLAGGGVPAYVPTPLLTSAPGDVWERARGEALAVPKGLEQADARALAWALAYQPAADAASAARGARLMVWGSRQAASDAVVGQAAFANGMFLAGACRWLAHRDAPPEVPPAELRAFQVAISDRSLEILLAVLAVIVPVLCIGGAIIAWLEQKR